MMVGRKGGLRRQLHKDRLASPAEGLKEAYDCDRYNVVTRCSSTKTNRHACEHLSKLYLALQETIQDENATENICETHRICRPWSCIITCQTRSFLHARWERGQAMRIESKASNLGDTKLLLGLSGPVPSQHPSKTPTPSRHKYRKSPVLHHDTRLLGSTRSDIREHPCCLAA